MIDREQVHLREIARLDAERLRTRQEVERLRAEIERLRSVYVSAIAWRENKYGSSRSWLATREDVDLVSVIDTATKVCSHD